MKIKLNQKQFDTLSEKIYITGQIEELDRCRPHMGSFRYQKRKEVLLNKLQKLTLNEKFTSTIFTSPLNSPVTFPKIVQYLKRK